MRKEKYSIAINPAVMSRVDFFASSKELSRSAAINLILDEYMKDRYGFVDVIAEGLTDDLIDGQTELPEDFE